MPRLYIGGLGPGVTEADLKKEFQLYGRISNLEIKEKKDAEGAVLTRFSYLNIEAEDRDIERCIGDLNGSTWRGSQLKVDVARESFLERLKREREGQSNEDDKDRADYSKRKKERHQKDFRVDENYNWGHTDFKSKSYREKSDQRNDGNQCNSRETYGFAKKKDFRNQTESHNSEFMDYESYRSKFLDYTNRDAVSGYENKRRERFDVEETSRKNSKSGVDKDESYNDAASTMYSPKRYRLPKEEGRFKDKPLAKASDDNDGKMVVKISDKLDFQQSSNFSLLSLFDQEVSREGISDKQETKQSENADCKETTSLYEERTNDGINRLNDSRHSYSGKEYAYKHNAKNDGRRDSFQKQRFGKTRKGPKTEEDDAGSSDGSYDSLDEYKERWKDQRPFVPGENNERRSTSTRSFDFFIKRDDPRLEDAVRWITTPITEEASEEFEKVKKEVMDILKLKRSRALHRRESKKGHHSFKGLKYGTKRDKNS